MPLIASALGLRPQQILGAQMLDNGPVWLGLLLDSADTVLGLHPDHARLKDLGQDVGVIHVGPSASNTAQPGVVVRAFAAPMGNPEDPVTGTLNASLAEWLIADGLAPAVTWWPRANAWAARAACTSARTMTTSCGWAAEPSLASKAQCCYDPAPHCTAPQRLISPSASPERRATTTCLHIGPNPGEPPACPTHPASLPV